jgi:hypothetical protein
VLRSFIAMVGLRNVGKELEAVLKSPWKAFGLRRSAPRIPVPEGASAQAQLARAARPLSRQIARFARACRNALIRHREDILDRQYVQARLGDTATELFLASCVYSRLCGLASSASASDGDKQRWFQAGLFYLDAAHRRNAERLNALRKNDDLRRTRTAEAWLED